MSSWLAWALLALIAAGAVVLLLTPLAKSKVPSEKPAGPGGLLLFIALWLGASSLALYLFLGRPELLELGW